MRMTAIHAQTEQKRQDRSVRCAEKHRPRANTQRLPGLICSVPADCATEDAGWGKKSLSGGQNQAIFTSASMPLRECRVMPGLKLGRGSKCQKCLVMTFPLCGESYAVTKSIARRPARKQHELTLLCCIINFLL